VNLKDGDTQRANHEHTRRLQDQRNGRIVPDPILDRELTLYWLRHYPAYREVIKDRVSAAAKSAEKLSRRIDDQYKDVDYLGREVEGCG